VRLLVFIHSLGRGGAERVTANLANHLAEEGWAITIATLAGSAQDCYELHPSVRRVVLDLAAESSNPLMAVANNLRRIRAMRRVLRELKPDAALGMMNTAAALLGIAARGLDVVTIGAERANPSTAPLGRAWSWLRRAGFRRLQAVVALTPEAARWLQLHAGARNIAVIPNAVVWPLPNQSPVVSPGSVGTPGRKRLLAVGRLSQVKGFDNLVRAFAQLAGRQSGWELVIVGEGPQRAALQSQIDSSGLSGQVILAGEVGNLVDWYQHAHLFVLSSRHEGFPNVLLEAMAHGLACVSFDCEAGPRNIVRDGVDGVLAKDQDVSALACALEQLMVDEELRARLAEKAREVRERFAVARILVMWRDLITKRLGLDGRIDIGQGVSRPV
jgi:glycosyltransferase involved in cell wall biosynthesis